MSRYFVFSVAAIAAFTLFSCGSEEPAETSAPDTVAVSETLAPEASVTYILPSPYQIAEMFRRAGLTYQPGLTLDPGKVSSFNSSFHKNLAFGLYSADLAYVTVNKQNQDGITYLKVIRELANDLGYGTVFDSESFFTRFEKNIGDDDSVAFLLGDLQLALTDMLSENNEDYISPIIFSAAWVESMYLGVRNYEDRKSENLMNKLEEQKVLLGNVLSALESHRDKFDGIPRLVEKLKKIDAELNNETGTDQAALKEAVLSVRQDIVSGSI